MFFTEEREISGKLRGNIVKIFPYEAEASRRGLEADSRKRTNLAERGRMQILGRD